MTQPTAPPSSLPIEDRLRAHYADRAASEPLPGPDTETALESLIPPSEVAVVGLTGRPPRPSWLVAAAVVVAIGAAAAVAVARRGDDGVATGNDPDPTVTMTPSTPTTADPTTSSTTSTTSSTVPSGPALPEGMSLVLGAGGPIGGWDGDSWVGGDAWSSVFQATGEETYRVVRLDEAVVTRTGRMEPCEGPEGDKPVVELFPWDNDAGGTGVAVTGVPDPRPRAVRVADPGDPSYLASARQVLTDLGIEDDAPDVVDAVEADLDGDGRVEVVLVVERVQDPADDDANPGDYSVLFVRSGAGTAVVQQDIVGGSNTILGRFRVDALADLNADGRMEIVSRAFSLELHGQQVATFDPDGTASEVLTSVVVHC